MTADDLAVALRAVASGDRRTMTRVAVDLGVSVPAMVQQVVGALDDPRVVAAHPREVRVLRERLERRQRARSGT